MATSYWRSLRSITARLHHQSDIVVRICEERFWSPFVDIFQYMLRYRGSFRSQLITSPTRSNIKIAGWPRSSAADSPTLPFPTPTRPIVLFTPFAFGSRSSSRPIKKPQQGQRPLVNPGLLRFPRASHVQDFDLVGAQEISQRLHFVAKGIRVEYSLFPDGIDVLDWLSKLFGMSLSQLGTSA
jgi:hypothetical protein